MIYQGVRAVVDSVQHPKDTFSMLTSTYMRTIHVRAAVYIHDDTTTTAAAVESYFSHVYEYTEEEECNTRCCVLMIYIHIHVYIYIYEVYTWYIF